MDKSKEILRKAQIDYWLEVERRALAERAALRAQRCHDKMVAQERAKRPDTVFYKK